MRRYVTDAALIVFVLALALKTASHTVQGADSGEFLTVAEHGGVPHPPGFPIYVLLARLAALLPLGSLAWRVSLLSVLCASIAVWCVYRASLAWGLRRSSALIGALGLAGTVPFWKMAGVAEVFACACAWAAGFAWACAARKPTVAGLCLGLGVATHPGVIFLAPLLFHATGREPKPQLRAAGATVVGLCAYSLLLVFARSGAWHWGDTSTLGGVVRHVLRMDYGTFALVGDAETTARGGQAIRFVWEIPQRWLLLSVPVAAGLLCLPTSLRVALVAVVLFYAMFNIGQSPLEQLVAERFFVFGDLLLALSCAFGVDWLQKRLSARPGRLFRTPAIWLAFALPTFVAAWPHVNWRNDRAIETYVQTALGRAAPNALIIGVGDIPTFPMMYGKYVLRLRPDVAYVDAELLLYRWYFESISREIGEMGVPYNSRNVDTVGFAMTQAARRPVYVTSIYNQAIGRVISHPEGPLIRLAGKGVVSPPCHTVEATLRAAREEDLLSVSASGAWGTWVLRRYVEAWQSVAACYEASKSAADAARARLHAQALQDIIATTP